MKKFTLGIDEAGRGALAGPLVAVGVLLPRDLTIAKLKKICLTPIRDGKTLSPNQRLRIVQAITTVPIVYKVTMISHTTIDSIGIEKANLLAFKNILDQFSCDSIIADGPYRYNKIFQSYSNLQIIPKADTKYPPVTLAGICAKHVRDTYMTEVLHPKHKKYDWNTNAGYGTQNHIRAILTYKRSIFHRKLFTDTACRNYLQKLKLKELLSLPQKQEALQ